MIETLICQNIVQTPSSAKFLVFSPIDHVWNTGKSNRPTTHDTRLNGHKKRTIQQAPALLTQVRILYGHNLRVHNRSLQLLTCIMPTTNNFSVLDNHTTNRNFIVFQGNLSLSQSLPHKNFFFFNCIIHQFPFSYLSVLLLYHESLHKKSHRMR